MKSARPANIRRGFTLIELLVVIGIMLLLMAILLPVVSQVRIRAYDTSTQSEMSRIMAACQMYYHDFNAYPGPIANAYLSGGAKPGADPSAAKLASPGGGPVITSSENLVLGLFGLLTPCKPPPAPVAPPTFTQMPFAPPLVPPTHDVLSLNPLHPASYHYMDYVAEELSPGPASSIEYLAGQTLTDTLVPEFVDHFPEKMPILYLRANTGNQGIASADDKTQYNWTEVAPYGSWVHMADPSANYWAQFTQASIQTLYSNSQSTLLGDDVASPYQDFVGTTGNYFLNPNIAGTARGKDGFILIGAGIDHVYGTTDDTIVTP
jgi:prepilin-type N-terminal cleavage/methylation domain-containing protein